MVDSFFLLVGLLGLEFGSFANVCIYRWPRDMSIQKPVRSHCPWCNKLIPWYENIPIFSFLFLKGKCSSCQSQISARYPFIEGIMSVLWLGVVCAISRNFEGNNFLFHLLSLGFVFVLVVTTMTDLDWKIIPDQASYGLLFMGLLLSPWNELLTATGAAHRFLQSAIGLFVGGGSLYGLSILGRYLFKKEAMGGGDIKLLASIGTILGWEGAIISLIFASLLGGVLAIFGILMGVLRKHQYIPFGPFLNLGAFFTFIAMILVPHRVKLLTHFG